MEKITKGSVGLCIDPATTISGWAVIQIVSMTPLKIRVIKRGSADGLKLARSFEKLSPDYQKRFCITEGLELFYINLIKEYNPDFVVSEGAFGGSHLAALISLTLSIHSLRKASTKILGKDIVEIPPSLSKKAMTGHGNADKGKMSEAYYSNGIVIDSLTPDPTEHEIDAVAHGIGYLRVFVTNEIEFESAADRRKRLRDKAKKEAEEKLEAISK